MGMRLVSNVRPMPVNSHPEEVMWRGARPTDGSGAGDAASTGGADAWMAGGADARMAGAPADAKPVSAADLPPQ